MATFINTVTFSDQGIKDIKATCKRASAFKTTAEKIDVQVRDIYWTLGPFDGLMVFDAPDEETGKANRRGRREKEGREKSEHCLKKTGHFRYCPFLRLLRVVFGAFQTFFSR